MEVLRKVIIMANKNKGGRPPKFKTAEELWNKFLEYKASMQGLKKKIVDKKTKELVEVEYDKPITLVGFCVYIDIHRDTLNDWKNNKPEFSDVIKKIYQECEADLIEKALMFESHADFAYRILMNAHGYTNKQEQSIDIGNKDGKPFEVASLTPEERKARIEELMKKMQVK